MTEKHFHSSGSYCRQVFGCKVYKLALSASVSCPNRDGTAGYGGCRFCSVGGSGDFAADVSKPLAEQLKEAKEILGAKGKNRSYIAYFQSFTGTYGNLNALEKRYHQAANSEGIVGISVATRPDCLGEREMQMLERLSEETTLWVELGLQTIHEKTAEAMNRCYPLSAYERAVEALRKLNVHIITHVILGLPSETREMMLETVSYVGARSDGIKLQLLHVLRGTALAEDYAEGKFEVLGEEEYCALVADALERLPEKTVIHRMTGDGAKRDLIAPLWSGNKKEVLNRLNHTLRERGIYVGQ